MRSEPERTAITGGSGKTYRAPVNPVGHLSGAAVHVS
jgi:hypothetical protein